MRPLSYRADELRALLLRNRMATLDELKHALGTSVDVTVFRKLKPLGYLSSYSHRGRYTILCVRSLALTIMGFGRRPMSGSPVSARC
jgi:hypothetical protein